MIQNWEPNWQANCRGFVELIKFASHWSAHSEADHICKFAFHWLAQVSTDQSETLLGVYTLKPPCLGSASEYLAQILLGFAAEDLSSNTPLPRLRLGGFTLKYSSAAPKELGTMLPLLLHVKLCHNNRTIYNMTPVIYCKNFYF